MTKTRVIPILLHRGMQLVKGKNYSSWRSVGFSLQAAQIHEHRSVDELIMLNIAATPSRTGPNLPLVKELTAQCFMPITVGGGISTIEHVRDLFRVGADKVVLGTAAYRTPKLVTEIAHRFGSQAVSVSVDIDDMGRVCVECGQCQTNEDPAEYAIRMADLGAGEIILNNIDREGTMQGYDLPWIEAVANHVAVPVVAASGAGTYQHMLDAVRAGAHAVAAGAMFQFTDQTPKGAAAFLQANGVEARVAA